MNDLNMNICEDMGQSSLIDRFRGGDVRALARVITSVENSGGLLPAELMPIFNRTERAFRIGITGPPGAGKSTLTDGLCALYRRERKTVGIIAVDPTSPFSGGALLGDRIRMNRAGLDPGVYIRSMATRGNLGGLAEAALDAADILDAFGKDIIILETVGVGQSELDIARATDSTIVVLVPESGDGVQAMKAGLMEIGDVFVLNKADRPSAERAAGELKTALELKYHEDSWNPPVIPTIANRSEGVGDLLDALKHHWRTLAESGLLKEKRRNRRRERIRQLVNGELRRSMWNEDRLELLEKRLDEGDNPFSIAAELKKDFLKKR
ncbi:methylmalonyl Co-A mutase-associated GTPase MeaB [candidate division LCP-89 bacterium B3_LCP]|uniref:Methylmalonyl Co-A mutase-associated GTPase MeaB n=1 Tax=candidate division LCP-89 bacterium B3_LCP TaxID=2012998 RepID=A0A532V541_UNCL8|nr:MAG: methylmalonyl Co-A mutase-associated GTPase MeaB [candidate division LCP-89 bacterium B3_LCP]